MLRSVTLQIARTVMANTVLTMNQSFLYFFFLRIGVFSFKYIWCGLKIAFFFFCETGFPLCTFCWNEEELGGMCARLKLARCIRDL